MGVMCDVRHDRTYVACGVTERHLIIHKPRNRIRRPLHPLQARAGVEIA